MMGEEHQVDLDHGIIQEIEDNVKKCINLLEIVNTVSRRWFFMKLNKIIISIFAFIIVVCIANTSTAMTHYQTVGTTTGLVTASALNVRQGPRHKF